MLKYGAVVFVICRLISSSLGVSPSLLRDAHVVHTDASARKVKDKPGEWVALYTIFVLSVSSLFQSRLTPSWLLRPAACGCRGSLFQSISNVVLTVLIQSCVPSKR